MALGGDTRTSANDSESVRGSATPVAAPCAATRGVTRANPAPALGAGRRTPSWLVGGRALESSSSNDLGDPCPVRSDRL